MPQIVIHLPLSSHHLILYTRTTDLHPPSPDPIPPTDQFGIHKHPYVGVPRSFHAYIPCNSRVSIGLLVVLCWSMGLIPTDPSQIAHHAYASCFLSFSTAPAKSIGSPPLPLTRYAHIIHSFPVFTSEPPQGFPVSFVDGNVMPMQQQFHYILLIMKVSCVSQITLLNGPV